MTFSTACFTTLANSSGLPGLAGNSMAFSRLLRVFSFMPALMRDWNRLGAMVTTRMPNRERSLAMGSVMDRTAPFVAEYETWPFCPSNAADEATMMMTPRSLSGP